MASVSQRVGDSTRRVCVKTPRDTGSARRYVTPKGLNAAALRVVDQAENAAEQGHPLAFIALALYFVDVHRPEGTRRSDARANFASIAAIMGAIGDYDSGRDCRPGRQVVAAVTGLCERTITNHWRIMEKAELILPETVGRLNTAEDRAETDRWRERSSWTLNARPSWAREVRDVDLAPYIKLAHQALLTLAYGGATRSFTPSLLLKVLSFTQVRRGSFSTRPRKLKRSRPVSQRPDGRKEQKGASRSSTRSASPYGRLASYPAEVAATALQLVEERRLPFLRPWMVADVAETLLATPEWLPDDVELFAERRVAAQRTKLMDRPGSPVDYFRWLMKGAQWVAPPAQRRTMERAWQAHVAASSVAGKPSTAREAAMAKARAIGAVAIATKLQEAMSYEQRQQAWAELDWPTVAQPGGVVTQL